MSIIAAFSPFASYPGMTGSGRTSPYAAEPGISFLLATNGELPAEPGSIPRANI